ncbi:MAG: cytochrome c maturation protein CcmE [Bacteroidota bacterium]
MKRSHIFGIILMAAAIGTLISMASSFSTYSYFADAIEQPEKKFQVVCYLSPEKPISYEPEVDPNKFTFSAKDKKDLEVDIVYLGAKPQDFERSEEIVLTGSYKGDQFIATDMLMKCPSKYTEEEIQLKEAEKDGYYVPNSQG